MELLRKRRTLRNQKVLIPLIKSHMCVDSSKRCMAPRKHPCAWYTRIENYLTSLGFTKSEVDANLYHILAEGKLFIIVLYVDDFILMCDDKLIRSCKEDLTREFKMKDMGLMHYFLELEVWQGDGELFVSQGKYANEIMKKFDMESSKPMETPLVTSWRKEDATTSEVVETTIYWHLMGSLTYLVKTQTNMCYEVNQVSQAMVSPTKLFRREANQVLRYLRGTTRLGLWYIQIEGVKLCGFTDVDWEGSPSDRKSTLGGIFNVGFIMVFGYNTKQRSVALSSV